jgi:hypothetical protein
VCVCVCVCVCARVRVGEREIIGGTGKQIPAHAALNVQRRQFEKPTQTKFRTAYLIVLVPALGVGPKPLTDIATVYYEYYDHVCQSGSLYRHVDVYAVMPAIHNTMGFVRGASVHLTGSERQEYVLLRENA